MTIEQAIKPLAICVAVVALTACTKGEYSARESKPFGNINVGYSQVVIDGCQYLVTSVHGGWTLAHKGNCTNTWHLKEAK